MKKAVVCLALVLFFASSGLATAGDVLKIATEGAYPPFNYVKPDGTLTGFDVDIAKELCSRMGADCELMTQAWDGIIPGLLAKKYDMIVASMSITPERKKAVNFTQPYYQAPPRFVGHKNAGLVISKEGLKDKAIGVQRAATYANYLEDIYGDTIDIKYYDTVENHNLDLVAGRVDAVLAQSVFMSKWLETEDGEDFKFYGDPITDEKYIGKGAGIAIRKGADELLQKVDAALQEMIEDGTHRKITRKYFDFDLYDYSK